ncbi:hypothetical protein MTO96_041120 [Rhipicephalus appendiculatus]
MPAIDRKILRDLGLEPREGKQQNNVPKPDNINRKLRVCPIPKNVNPEHNKERRLARARALVGLQVREEGAVYVYAAEYQGSSDAYAAVVVGASTGATKTEASVRTRETHRAEEVAIDLAVSDPGCTTVLCDSRTAAKNCAKGRRRWFPRQDTASHDAWKEPRRCGAHGERLCNGDDGELRRERRRGSSSSYPLRSGSERRFQLQDTASHDAWKGPRRCSAHGERLCNGDDGELWRERRRGSSSSYPLCSGGDGSSSCKTRQATTPICVVAHV